MAKKKTELLDLKFVAPAAMKIKREFSIDAIGVTDWPDLEIDQGFVYEFFDCSRRGGYSGIRPGEWAFKKEGINYGANRVLSPDVPRIHAILTDLMASPVHRVDRSKCEICGSNDRVDSGPWDAPVFIDLGVTDAALCFACANYRPTGETGPKIRDGRLNHVQKAKRERLFKKIETLKEIGFIPNLTKPVYICFERLNLSFPVRNGELVEFVRYEENNKWQLRSPGRGFVTTEPDCILWIHAKLRQIRRKAIDTEQKRRAREMVRMREEAQKRFRVAFADLEDE